MYSPYTSTHKTHTEYSNVQHTDKTHYIIEQRRRSPPPRTRRAARLMRERCCSDEIVNGMAGEGIGTAAAAGSRFLCGKKIARQIGRMHYLLMCTYTMSTSSCTYTVYRHIVCEFFFRDYSYSARWEIGRNCACAEEMEGGKIAAGLCTRSCRIGDILCGCRERCFSRRDVCV